MWLRLSPSEKRLHQLEDPPGAGDFYWDDEGKLVIWYPRSAAPEDIHRARARFHFPVGVGRGPVR